MPPTPLDLFASSFETVNASLSNSTDVASSTAANNGNSNVSTDENIVALVIAIAAFVISFLQTFLAFLTSSASCDKCSRGALGGWHIYTKTGWDFSTSRLQVTYPRVNIDCFEILKLSEEYNVNYFDQFPALNDFGYQRGYRWDDRWDHRKKKLRRWHIWHGTVVLADQFGDPVSIFSLCLQPFALFEWISFWYRMSGTGRERVGSPMGARATWANMISCFDVPASQAKKLILGQELAAGIPSSIDAPAQLTSLANVALCAFILGLRDVDIDLKKGSITAQNEHASITSMETNIPGIPYFVTLQ
jgi:hypothetical protein